MPRTRQLKHDFFLNEELSKLRPHARLLFAGLWLLADREGRLKDEPGKIKAQLFPYESLDIDKLLKELSEGFIMRYEVGGKRLLAIPSLVVHQKIHPNEKASELPAPPSEVLKNREMSLRAVKSNDIIPCSYSYSYSKSIKQTASRKKELGQWFEIAFDLYPNHERKESARKVWSKLAPEAPTYRKILLAIKAASQKFAGRENKYIPLFKNWLPEREWDNKVKTNGSSNGHAPEYMSPEWIEQNTKAVTKRMIDQGASLD